MPARVCDAVSYTARCGHDTAVPWCGGQKDHLAHTLLGCCDAPHLLPWPLSDWWGNSDGGHGHPRSVF